MSKSKPRKVSIKDIAEGNLKETPEPCRSCIYWENPDVIEQNNQKLLKRERARRAVEKAAWFSKTLEEFGCCGKIVYVDNKAVGYAQYCPSHRLPNTKEYRAERLGTAEEKTVFISCPYICDESFRGKGLGKKLLDEVIADLKKRGFKSVETFARKGSANNPSGPIELYLGKGFHVREDMNSEYALVRLNLWVGAPVCF